MSRHVILLGDSIFDNAAYVLDGPAVIDQVRKGLPTGWSASLLARDGSMIQDVDAQLEMLPADATDLVVSIGGNDTLNEIGVLGKRVGTVGEGVKLLADIQDRFEDDYRRLLPAFVARGLPTVVCTIYSPRFPDPGLQREAVTALCLFNDCIIRAAYEFHLPVLDLRAVCTDDIDYANPIEPSTVGGEKIARAICAVLSGAELGRQQTLLLP